MGELDYRAASFWLDFAQWLSIGVVAVWAYLRTKDDDNQQAVAKVAKELGDFIRQSIAANELQNTRLTKVEETLQHMPTNEEITHLARDLATVKAQVNGVAALLERVEHQTQLIHEHLLNGKR